MLVQDQETEEATGALPLRSLAATSSSTKKPGFLPPADAAAICLLSGGPRAMGARWILARVGGRAPFLVIFFSFARVCVLKTRRWWLPEDGIEVSPPSPCSGGASSIVGGRVEVCLRRIYRWWICSDLVVIRLHSYVFGLDPFYLHYSLSAAVAVLVCWSYGALARRLPGFVPDSNDGGVMTATRLRLASVLVVVARWSTNLDVFFYF
ncbi:uncharacterized protein [Triticum aestivum]|uniref:uncharacterized protein n=1 Tax=Triticum aestivum TaxID=4565 RepID=UPI001D025369|nr:uncharacterized protein LOC123144675 [Triticum aestivum]